MRPLRTAATACGRRPPASRTLTRNPAPRSAAAYMSASVSFSAKSWKPTTIRGPPRTRAGDAPRPGGAGGGGAAGWLGADEAARHGLGIPSVEDLLVEAAEPQRRE